MATSKDDVEVPDYDENVNEFAATQQAAAENKKQADPGSNPGSGSKARGTGSSRSGSKKGEEEPEEDDSRKRDPFTATLERGLRRRMNGMVHHAQTVGKPENVASISDYVNMAIAEKLQRDEKRLNNGRPFPEPLHMRTGRPLKRRR